LHLNYGVRTPTSHGIPIKHLTHIKSLGEKHPLLMHALR